MLLMIARFSLISAQVWFTYRTSILCLTRDHKIMKCINRPTKITTNNAKWSCEKWVKRSKQFVHVKFIMKIFLLVVIDETPKLLRQGPSSGSIGRRGMVRMVYYGVSGECRWRAIWVCHLTCNLISVVDGRADWLAIWVFFYF